MRIDGVTTIVNRGRRSHGRGLGAGWWKGAGQGRLDRRRGGKGLGSIFASRHQECNFCEQEKATIRSRQLVSSDLPQDLEKASIARAGNVLGRREIAFCCTREALI